MAAAAYLGTVAAHAEAEAQRQRDQQEAARASQRGIYTAVLGNPNATSEQRAYAIDNLNKLNQGAGSKKGQSPYDTLGDHISRVGQHLQDAGHPEASSPGVLHTLPKLDGTPAQATTPMVNASAQQSAVPASTPSLPPISQDAAAPMAGRDPQAMIGSTGPDAGGDSSTPSPAAAASTTPTTSLPPISPNASTVGPNAPIGSPAHAFATGVQHGAGKVLSFIGNRLNSAQAGYNQPGINLPPLAPDIDPSMIPSPVPPQLKFDPNPIEGASIDPSGVDRFGNQIDPTKKYVAAPDPRGGVIINGRPYSVQTSVPKPSGASPRSLGATISMDDARNLQQSGQPVLNEHGQPYDLSKVPANMKFQAVGLPGGGVGYLLGTEKQVKRTNGNENFIVNEFEQADPNKYVATGVARTATASQTETPVLDADGVVHMVPKYSSHSPVTSGVSGTAAQLPGGAVLNPQQPTALPGNPANVDLTNPHSTTGIPTPHPPRAMIPQNQQPGAPAPKPSASAPPNSSMGRAIPGAILPGQANQLRQRNTALNGTTMALETAIRPDPSTGKSYLDLFKPENTAERGKVADFIRLNDSIAEGEYNQAAGSGEGLASLASFGVGIPEMVAHSKNQALVDAYSKIQNDPAATKAIADYYNLIGQIGGMRKATGANASQWSFQNLKQEVPSPLLDGNYGGVVAKMHNLVNEVNSNAKPNLQARPFDTSLLNNLGTPASGRTVSLKDAMALPINKGKTSDQVTADIRAHGHEVRP